MYDNLRKSFYAKQSDFWSWQRLADHPQNPHRLQDFTAAAIIAGRLATLAVILDKEYNDTTFLDDAAEAVRWAEETAEALTGRL